MKGPSNNQNSTTLHAEIDELAYSISISSSGREDSDKKYMVQDLPKAEYIHVTRFDDVSDLAFLVSVQ